MDTTLWIMPLSLYCQSLVRFIWSLLAGRGNDIDITVISETLKDTLWLHCRHTASLLVPRRYLETILKNGLQEVREKTVSICSDVQEEVAVC